MSPESLVQVGLMAFVLLAPAAMVAVLVSGLSRRSSAGPDPLPARPEPLPEPVAARTS